MAVAATAGAWDIDSLAWWVMTLRDAGLCQQGYAVLRAWPPLSEDSYRLMIIDQEMAEAKCKGKEYYEVSDARWYSCDASFDPRHVLNGSATETRAETTLMWVPKKECRRDIADIAAEFRRRHPKRVAPFIREIQSR